MPTICQPVEKKQCRPYGRVVCAIALLLTLPSIAAAQTTWNSTTSTDWFAAGNWNPSAIPTSSDAVLIDLGMSGPVITSAAVANSIQVGSGPTSSGVLTISSSGNLNVGSALSIDNGTVNDNGNASITGSVNVGIGGGAGTLNVQNGGSFSTLSTVFISGDASSVGHVVVDGSGSSLSIGSLLFVGLSDTGTLTIQNGGTVIDASGAYVGLDSNSVSTAIVAGKGSSWTSGYYLTIGKQGGTGIVTVSDGANVTITAPNWGIFLGQGSSGTSGTLNVETGGTVNAGSLIAGDGGVGTLNISDGGIVDIQKQVLVSDGAGSVGTVNVTSVDSSLVTNKELIVGDVGTGSLNISAGGRVSDTVGYIGEIGSSGTATVTGTGARWNNSGDLYIGDTSSNNITLNNAARDSGVGVLTISNGGVVTTGSGLSYVDQGPLINLGVSDTHISSSTAYIALSAGSTGTLNIGAPAGSPATAPGTLIANTVALGAGRGSIVFNHTSSYYAFTPAITGNGTIDALAGNTFLAGNISGFTGNFDIAPGANLTTMTEQQSAAQNLANREQATLIESRSTANELLGMTRPVDNSTYAYAGAMFGSAEGLFGGQYSNHGVTLLGGIAYGEQGYPEIEQSDAPTVAAALRYTFDDPFGDEGKILHPYAELGGWVTPHEILTPQRNYMAGTMGYTGQGDTGATSWAEYGRLGMLWMVDEDNTLTGYGEMGQQALSFGAYSESQSSSNPFPATVGAGVLRYDVAKLGGAWTRDLYDLVYAPLSVTLAGAAAHAFDAHAGLNMAVDGVNLGSASGTASTWGEFGARFNAKITEQTTLSLGLLGTTGAQSLNTSVHGDVGISYKF